MRTRIEHASLIYRSTCPARCKLLAMTLCPNYVLFSYRLSSPRHHSRRAFTRNVAGRFSLRARNRMSCLREAEDGSEKCKSCFCTHEIGHSRKVSSRNEPVKDRTLKYFRETSRARYIVRWYFTNFPAFSTTSRYFSALAQLRSRALQTMLGDRGRFISGSSSGVVRRVENTVTSRSRYCQIYHSAIAPSTPLKYGHVYRETCCARIEI